MQKILQHCVWTVSLCATFLLNVACSAESSAGNEYNTQDTGTVQISDAQFTLEETPYEHAKEFTRALSDTIAESTGSFNGLDASVSVEPDREAAPPITRAAATKERYTIYATDMDGRIVENSKITGYAYKSGNSVIFKPNATSLEKMSLAAGKKYIFVCFNEHIFLEGDKLVIRGGAEAQLGVTEPVLVSNHKFRVKFNMKHQTARVRIKICGYTKQGSRM